MSPNFAPFFGEHPKAILKYAFGVVRICPEDVNFLLPFFGGNLLCAEAKEGPPSQIIVWKKKRAGVYLGLLLDNIIATGLVLPTRRPS